jgi:hypothetical protein
MDRALAYMERCAVIQLDTRIALQAADICAVHKLSTADAIVYASALQNEVKLLTCNAHFKGAGRCGIFGEGLMITQLTPPSYSYAAQPLGRWSAGR